MNESKTPNPVEKTGESVTPKQQTTDSSNSSPAQPSVVSNIAPSPKNKDDTDGRKDSTPLWKKVIEGGALIVAIGLLIVNIVQMCATRKAADAAKSAADTARDTLIASSRPWISVDIQPAGPITWEGGGLQVSYKISLKNIGKSPALKVAHLETIVLEIRADLVKEQVDLGKMVTDSSRQALGIANIMPSDIRQMIVHEQVDKQAVERAKKPWTSAGGRELIEPVLLGIVSYYVEFDKVERHTGFVYEIGFWDPSKGIIVTALDPVNDGVIPTKRVRILRHPLVDAPID